MTADLPLKQSGRPTAKVEQKREIVLANRRAQVAELWVRGRMTVRQIAEQLGVSVGTVSTDKKAIVEEWKSEASGAYSEFVMREWKALDGLERKLHGWLTEASDYDTRCKLVDRLVKIQESRRKLLGLDAPQRFEVLDSDGDSKGAGVLVDLDGLPALIPGPEDRDGYEAAEVGG